MFAMSYNLSEERKLLPQMLLEYGTAATLVNGEYFGQVAGHGGDALGVRGKIATRPRHGHLFARRHRCVADPEDA